MRRSVSSPNLLLAAIAAFTLVLYRTAWVCDDAYIIFRTADNLMHGFGLRWNISERVQSFTCPLWLLVFSCFYRFTHEAFYTCLALCAIMSLTVVILLCSRARAFPTAILFVGSACVISKAFTDYSTSGLENPLTHLLLVLFLIVFFKPRGRAGLRRPLLLGLIASLLCVNRLDTALLTLPPLLLEMGSTRPRWRAAAAVAAGFTPLALWFAFSLFYYGFLFPNTAYAKLNTGIGADTLLWQGFSYFIISFQLDPITLSCIAMAVAIAAWSRKAPQVAVMLGVFLYLAYITKIGGDFMAGRFFSAPFVVSLFVIGGQWQLIPSFLRGAAVFAALAAGLINPQCSPLFAGQGYGSEGTDDSGIPRFGGVGDERAGYYPTCGLLRRSLYPSMPAHFRRFWAQNDITLAATEPVQVTPYIGFRGYFGGPGITYVDPLALSEPLLARLPALATPNIRMGHFTRAIPKGYLLTVMNSKNQIADPRLAKYYDSLHLIVSGPLWSSQRLTEVLKMNLGEYDSLIDRDYYMAPLGYQPNPTVIDLFVAPPPPPTRPDK